jgi:hypothetical protein
MDVLKNLENAVIECLVIPNELPPDRDWETKAAK